jgi:hypothetical protein
MATKWIITDNTGWLRVLIDYVREESLPEFLQVNYEGRKINVPANVKDGEMVITGTGKRIPITKDNRYYRMGDRNGLERDFFTILEGPYRNKKACVTARAAGESWFEDAAPRPPAKLEFIVTASDAGKYLGELKFNARAIVAITDMNNPVPDGRHVLQIPDAPHRGGRSYVSACSRPHTWFRIGSHGDRYLHTGFESIGCIAVDPIGWDDLYEYLIKARAGDGENVGTVRVFNKLRIRSR